ncbi:MAG: hypothetical protein VXW65_12130, partial [Pseudomonadota bacterium]|nr:hypothetical protein [Pseudomonadota bacterium]
ANPQTRTYRAKFSGIPNTWRLGMTAQLSLVQAGQPAIAAVLPATSLIQRQSDQPFVWLVTAKGQVVAKPVQVLHYHQNTVSVLGLSDGDQVVSVGGQKLDASMSVRAIVRRGELGMEQQP